jgi:hypothetical protein
MSIVRAQIAEAVALVKELDTRTRKNANVLSFKLAKDLSHIVTGFSTICRMLQTMNDDEIKSYDSAFAFMITSIKAILENDQHLYDVDEVRALESDINDIIEVLV